MAQSLYRTYRPQTFDEVIGQEHITDLLKNAISKNKITHSYLFTGPRGLGKTSVARIFAKALNCENISKDGNPCNECNNCKSITNGTYFDLLEIDAASNRGIDQIRELKEKIAYQPTQGKFKVYIIDEVHMLTTEAFNALLKTLEEPPSHAIFVLATTESYKLPATIVSRCQKYDFRLGSHEKLRDCLISVLKNEGRKMDEEAIQIIIEQSTGSYRDLLSLSDVVLSGIADLDIEVSEVDVRQSLGLPDHTMVYYFLENLVKGDYKKSFNMLDEVYQKGVSIQQFIYSVIDILKQILIDKTVKGRRKKSTITADFSFLEKLSDVTLFKLLKKFLDVTQSIKDSPIPTLPIEVLILESQELFDMEREEKEDEKKNSKIEEIEVDKETEKDIYKKSQKKEGKLESKKSLKKMPKKETGDSTKSISIENLTKKWDKVISNIREYNGHLYAFLNQAELLSCKEGILKFKVPFAFHKDRITTVQSKIAIQESFEKVFGFKPKIWCKVGKCKNDVVNTIPKVDEVESSNDGENSIATSESFVKEVEDVFKDI